MTKKQFNVRISTITRRQIDELAAATNATVGEVVMIAVDRFYREEKSRTGGASRASTPPLPRKK